MKPSLPLLALLAAAFSTAAPALAGDPAAEAAARLQEQWNQGLETKTPAEQDEHRKNLLEPVSVAASPAAFEAILKVARERAGQVKRFRDRLKEIAEIEKDRKEQEEKDKEDKDGKKAPGLTQGEAQAAADRLIREKEDKEKIPARLEREERWQPRLAEALAKVMDAMPDGEFAKTAGARVHESLGGAVEGWSDWIADALGRSKKERTARILLEAAWGAIGEYRKALAGRAKPSADLDKATDAMNKKILRHLEERQKQGDFSGQYPAGLVSDGERREVSALEVEVGKWTSQMEEADLRRRAAARGLGALLAGVDPEVQGRVLDLLEKEAVGAKDFEARALGLLAVGPCPGDRPMKLLREATKDPAPEVVVGALEALGGRGEAEALDILVASLADPRWQVRSAAAGGIANYGRALGVPHLITALEKAVGRDIDDLRDALVKLTRRKYPGAAAAWQQWWATEGEKFRGPKDPGYEAGAGGAEAGASDAAEGGNRVSFYGIETRSERMLFVLDFSGSMNFEGSEAIKNRKKIDILLEEMKRTLAGLPEGSKFNLVGFSSDVRVWKKGGANRDAKTAKEAMDWIEKQRVVGSTNIYDALETCFKMMGVGAASDKRYEPAYDTIFFMTDGVPTSGKVTDKTQILGEVRRWNEGRKIRIHVVGMGGKRKTTRGPGGAPEKDIDTEFLEKLAAEHNGQVVFR